MYNIVILRVHIICTYVMFIADVFQSLQIYTFTKVHTHVVCFKWWSEYDIHTITSVYEIMHIFACCCCKDCHSRQKMLKCLINKCLVDYTHAIIIVQFYT